jgi:hypothetical protein
MSGQPVESRYILLICIIMVGSRVLEWNVALLKDELRPRPMEDIQHSLASQKLLYLVDADIRPYYQCAM